MVDPIDLQHSVDRTEIAKKIELANKEAPQDQQRVFAKELEKENEEKLHQVQKTENSEADLKVKDEKEDKGRSKQQKKEKSAEDTENGDTRRDDLDEMGPGNLIDIKA